MWQRAIVVLLGGLVVSAASADGPQARPDAHAPIGVMGEHRHKRGEIMLSYRYARMFMSGNRSRTEEQSRQDVFARGFSVAPTRMETQMHLVGAMWAPTDRVTLMGMVPFLVKSMDHQTAGGMHFTTDTAGIGDVKLTGLVGLWQRGGHTVHLNAGLSIPSGSIDEKDSTPGGRQQLPYPMQLGSGSLDVIPGITYLGHTQDLSWGAQALGTIRTYQNGNRYRMGDGVDVTSWIARPWTPWLSTSLRASFAWWANYRGADPALDPNLVPTADPDRRGGWRVELWPGINLLSSKGHRLAVEAGFPVAQWLSGPQLETDWRLVVGWQKAFGPFEILGL